MTDFDVIVVGAGHAGCEAALAAARVGKKALLFTMNLDTIAQLSCNPAMGGIAKGQIIREIDALGGEIGKITDKSMIQFSMLNMSKGPAVHSPRAQCDKVMYHINMKQALEKEPNLLIKQDEIIGVKIKNKKICGVITKNKSVYKAKAVIITTGTFLNGLIHVGKLSYKAGRAGEFASYDLCSSLVSLGFETKRLKTGTPVRILKKSIDFTHLKAQYGDDIIKPFSFSTTKTLKNKALCFITYTNEKTHEIIRKNIKKSPLYSGRIKGIGPRYCPSIEDKIKKFPDMKRHQLFLEPESLKSDEIYCNGISSSLPEEVQREFVHSIKGLKNAEISRIGYAIEYNFFPPTQLKISLETKVVDGLYFAGQINGTTGYEEAAALGLIAGINACRKLNNKTPFVLKRSEAYIGVLIDDLVTKGVLDPYRMFTSRAEYRLLLRNDNIDSRLLKYGYELGLIKKSLFSKYLKYEKTLNKIKEKLEKIYDGQTSEAQKIRRNANYKDWINKIEPDLLNSLNNNGHWDKDTLITNTNIEIKYAGYIKRQLQDVKRMEKLENKKIPEDIDYNKIKGLLTESRHKLAQIKPLTVGQASRISGINPTDITLLLIFLDKEKRRKKKEERKKEGLVI